MGSNYRFSFLAKSGLIRRLRRIAQIAPNCADCGAQLDVFCDLAPPRRVSARLTFDATRRVFDFFEAVGANRFVSQSTFFRRCTPGCANNFWCALAPCELLKPSGLLQQGADRLRLFCYLDNFKGARKIDRICNQGERQGLGTWD